MLYQADISSDSKTLVQPYPSCAGRNGPVGKVTATLQYVYVGKVTATLQYVYMGKVTATLQYVYLKTAR
jgi:hypothetical protein